MLPGTRLTRIVMALVALFVVLSMLVTLLPNPAN
jgi:preprotein translocase subunit SecG